VQEIPVVQRLQPEIAEAQVARGVERASEPGEVEFGHPRVEQLGFDPAADVFREVGSVPRLHVRVPGVLAQHLLLDRVQKQPRRHITVGRLLLEQRARCEDRGLAHFRHRYAVVEIAQRRLEDCGRGNRISQAHAGRGHQVGERRWSSGLRMPFCST
jgi:hypothetical protein